MKGKLIVRKREQDSWVKVGGRWSSPEELSSGSFSNGVEWFVSFDLTKLKEQRIET